MYTATSLMNHRLSFTATSEQAFTLAHVPSDAEDLPGKVVDAANQESSSSVGNRTFALQSPLVPRVRG